MIIPVVDAMLVRRFTPLADNGVGMQFFGGVLVASGDWQIEEIGRAESRLPYDEDIVDCSNRMFQITTFAMLMPPDCTFRWTCFTSRRWRNMREGEKLTGMPTRATPLLYIGNPLIVHRDEETMDDEIPAIQVFVPHGEFLVKSGMELGY